MAIVVDASAVLAQAFDDEIASYAEAVLGAISTGEGVVPTIFWYEVRNALLMGERRKRLTPARTQVFLAGLAQLPWVVDESPGDSGVLALARKHALSVYDAAYLELAQRRHLTLASLDEALVKAAKAARVRVFAP